MTDYERMVERDRKLWCWYRRIWWTLFLLGLVCIVIVAYLWNEGAK